MKALEVGISHRATCDVAPASSLASDRELATTHYFLTNVVEPQQCPESERRTLVPGASRSR